MGLEVGYIKLRNNLTSKLFSMPLETEKIEREFLDLCGFQE